MCFREGDVVSEVYKGLRRRAGYFVKWSGKRKKGRERGQVEEEVWQGAGFYGWDVTSRQRGAKPGLRSRLLHNSRVRTEKIIYSYRGVTNLV